MTDKKWIQEDLNQPHLLEGLAQPAAVAEPHIDDFESKSTSQKRLAEADPLSHLVDQLRHADKNYPGGLTNYLSRARNLLEQSAAGVNPYDGFDVEVPKFCQPEIGSEEFYELEKIGLQEVEHCGFVLVAGGLGERLGYPDIKIGLATNMLTRCTYIEYYFDCIKAFQQRAASKNLQLPVMIMTSGDTHAKTVALLESHNYFSLSKQQVKIIQQEKVPALSDNAARIAFVDCPKSGLRHVVLKPHGHGDVHTLIHQHKVAEQWIKDHSMKWVLFFQDTNALTFKALPVFLGVSKTRDFHMNSLCIPRTPGDSVGAICKLSNSKSKEEFTINVEYNQLDALLKGMGAQGDVPAEGSQFSPFPGNCNILLFNLTTYSEILEKTKGVVPEFVNPKYADQSKTKFKSPTRVECMMQEFARLFDTRHDVGATVLPRWFCFSTVKNNIVDAAGKMQKDLPGECAYSGEFELYANNVRLLDIASTKTGTRMEAALPRDRTFHGMTMAIGPQVLLAPSYALTLTELRQRLAKTKSIRIATTDSSLILEGDCSFDSLDVEGHFHLSASTSGTCSLGDVKVSNDGAKLESVDIQDEAVPLMERVRGYRRVRCQGTHVSGC